MPRKMGATGRNRQTGNELDALGDLNLDFSTSPTTSRFLSDDSFFRGLMGPVGSGKSYGCASEILLRAVRQAPSPVDNIRYTRFVVIRNTYGELRTTTIRTWLEIFPEHIWGPIRWSPPITHHLQLPSRDGVPGLDCEVIFLALDDTKSVRKLLSLEVTGGWCNEARELPLAVIQGLTARVGRYPSKTHGGCTWRGIWADTNPPDDDGWWYRLAEKEPVKGKYKWNFYTQPGGMMEVPADTAGAIYAAGKHWLENPKAENVKNLPLGYYEQQLGGKNLDWIRCYVGAQYVYVQEGKAVWAEYDDSTMVDDTISYTPELPLLIGCDFGLTPAAVIGQRLPSGAWHILEEIVTEDMGLQRFGQMLLQQLNMKYPKAEVILTGDPAGQARDPIFETTAFDHLRTLGFTKVQPAPTNDFGVRREAGAAPMIRLIDRKPGLRVARTCPKLRKALAGGYHFKRVGVPGEERFRDAPNKNQHSHVGDAFSYLMLGGGEYKRLTRSGMNYGAESKQYTADFDFDIL